MRADNSGKVALVTGASKGIGQAIAERLAADGAAIAVRYGEDAAGAAETVRRAFLASPEASWVTGQVVRTNGGWI